MTFSKALGKNYRTPNHFPAREEDEWSIGRVVVLTKKTHRDFFSQLGDFEEADFELKNGDQEFGRAQTDLRPNQSGVVRLQTPRLLCEPAEPLRWHGRRAANQGSGILFWQEEHVGS